MKSFLNETSALQKLTKCNLNSPSASSSAASLTQQPSNATNTIYWFRKSLRLHDNPCLVYALENSQKVYPVFILDPWFVRNARVGANRWRFLVQSLQDLHQNLQKINSGLILVRGQPVPVFREKFAEWDISMLCFENDTEPYAKQRDAQVKQLAKEFNVKVETKWAHTLYNPDYLHERNGKKVCLTYQAFGALLAKIGEPPKPLPEPAVKFAKLESFNYDAYKVPELAELGVDADQCGPCLFPGGETEALRRMEEKMKNEAWVCQFEKPNTSPNSLEPSTTVLSPYLKFGCLSARVFYYRLKEIYQKRKHSLPPVSLHGQLLWREFFCFVGHFTPNFDKIEGNSICRQINWDDNEAYVSAWRNGQTGFPFIDAIMTQLRQEGWIHHLARHAVACFLTRGDLYQSWVKGQEVFEGNLSTHNTNLCIHNLSDLNT